jgi:hypothetical protein
MKDLEEKVGEGGNGASNDVVEMIKRNMKGIAIAF